MSADRLSFPSQTPLFSFQNSGASILFKTLAFCPCSRAKSRPPPLAMRVRGAALGKI
jgi:hypothetical protein